MNEKELLEVCNNPSDIFDYIEDKHPDLFFSYDAEFLDEDPDEIKLIIKRFLKVLCPDEKIPRIYQKGDWETICLKFSFKNNKYYQEFCPGDGEVANNLYYLLETIVNHESDKVLMKDFENDWGLQTTSTILERRDINF